MQNDKIFINKSNRIFTVRLMWDIGQPFVCGTLEEVVKYAIQPNNGIEYFAELTGNKFKRVSKKDLKAMLSHSSLTKLGEELFKKY
jgi:hypothetical protein